MELIQMKPTVVQLDGKTNLKIKNILVNSLENLALKK